MAGATIGIASQYFGDPIRCIRNVHGEEVGWRIGQFGLLRFALPTRGWDADVLHLPACSLWQNVKSVKLEINKVFRCVCAKLSKLLQKVQL